jgi:Ca2+/Na+ antiporter
LPDEQDWTTADCSSDADGITLLGAQNNEPYVVESKSLTFSLVLLIIMLVFVVVSIAAAGWKMSKRLGGVMFALYGVFLALVLLKSANMLGALNDV